MRVHTACDERLCAMNGVLIGEALRCSARKSAVVRVLGCQRAGHSVPHRSIGSQSYSNCLKIASLCGLPICLLVHLNARKLIELAVSNLQHTFLRSLAKLSIFRNSLKGSNCSEVPNRHSERGVFEQLD